MATLDDIADIFTGGLQTALDIEAERARADIERMRTAEDNRLASKGDSGALYRTGTEPSRPPNIKPLLLIGAGLVAVALVVVLLRN